MDTILHSSLLFLERLASFIIIHHSSQQHTEKEGASRVIAEEAHTHNFTFGSHPVYPVVRRFGVFQFSILSYNQYREIAALYSLSIRDSHLLLLFIS
jgi:hypothetical protein